MRRAGFCRLFWFFVSEFRGFFFYLILGLLNLVSDESLRQPRGSLVELGGLHWTERAAFLFSKHLVGQMLCFRLKVIQDFTLSLSGLS